MVATGGIPEERLKFHFLLIVSRKCVEGFGVDFELLLIDFIESCDETVLFPLKYKPTIVVLYVDVKFWFERVVIFCLKVTNIEFYNISDVLFVIFCDLV